MNDQIHISKTWLVRRTIVVSFICLGLILIGIFGLDQHLAQFFASSSMSDVYYYSREITNVGYSIHYFLIAGVLYVLSRYFPKRIKYLASNPKLTAKVYFWSSLTLKCLIFTGILVQILKFLFGRQRPHTTPEFESLNFEFFNFHHHWHSFPSGHTQVMFTVGSILSLIYPRQSFWLLLAVALLGFTRVAINQHFFSDYIFGASIGYLSTLWIYWYSTKQEQKN